MSKAGPRCSRWVGCSQHHSAESGLKTFRGDGGLWEGHRVEDVATPEAWGRDPSLVLEFYNGEDVPALEDAAKIVSRADVFLCVGTSLQVYPANSLIFATPRRARRIVINPEVPDLVPQDVCECIAKPASEGVPELVASLLRAAAG